MILIGQFFLLDHQVIWRPGFTVGWSILVIWFLILFHHFIHFTHKLIKQFSFIQMKLVP